VPCAASCALADERRNGTNAKRLARRHAHHKRRSEVECLAVCAPEEDGGQERRRVARVLQVSARRLERTHTRTHAAARPHGRIRCGRNQIRSRCRLRARPRGTLPIRPWRVRASRASAPAHRGAQAVLLCMRERAPARRTAKRPISSSTRRCSLQMHANGIADGRSRPSTAALASRFKRARARFPLQASRRAAPPRCS
jgi:hypothetical protein